jgi:hypothetical protein
MLVCTTSLSAGIIRNITSGFCFKAVAITGSIEEYQLSDKIRQLVADV